MIITITINLWYVVLAIIVIPMLYALWCVSKF